MLSFQSLLHLTKRIPVLSNHIGSLILEKPSLSSITSLRTWKIPTAQIHITSRQMDIMEFFDDKTNWGKNEVKSGRAWTADELRLKSNTDLHKLWFVLLKERNMLFTMEYEANTKYELFPSPERIDKVNLSMENIETVVRERNRAYHLLETGEDGERPGKVVHNVLGLTYFYRMREHFIPKSKNTKWFRTFNYNHKECEPFLKLYREKIYNVRRRAQNRDRNEVTHLLRRYPNVSKELLTKRYPTVNIDKIVREDKARGHFALKQ